jgi:hypothetical protein
MQKTYLLGLIVLGAAVNSFGADLVGTWEFNNNFNADQSGVPALTAVDPEGTSVFQTDTVFGVDRTVWSFNGDDNTPTDQAGLTLNTTGLVNPESYSVNMILEFTQRDGAWRRLLDTQNRQSDNGFYVDPSNDLDVYPVSGSTAGWDNTVYHDVVLTVDGTTVNAYLDGVSQLSTTTSEMDLDFDPASNPDQLLGFFLDNVVAGGQGEWSPGNIALAQLYDGVLSADDAQALATHPFPEPGAALVLLALPVCCGRRRRAV